MAIFNCYVSSLEGISTRRDSSSLYFGVPAMSSRYHGSRLGLSRNFHRRSVPGNCRRVSSSRNMPSSPKNWVPRSPNNSPKSAGNWKTSRMFFVGSCWTTHQNIHFIGDIGECWNASDSAWFSIQFLKLFAVVYFYVYDSACIYIIYIYIWSFLIFTTKCCELGPANLTNNL